MLNNISPPEGSQVETNLDTIDISTFIPDLSNPPASQELIPLIFALQSQVARLKQVNSIYLETVSELSQAIESEYAKQLSLFGEDSVTSVTIDNAAWELDFVPAFVYAAKRHWFLSIIRKDSHSLQYTQIDITDNWGAKVE